MICTKRFEREKAEGTWDMTYIVGRHWFAGSWNKPWLLHPDKDKKKESKRQRSMLQQIPRRILGALPW